MNCVARPSLSAAMDSGNANSRYSNGFLSLGIRSGCAIGKCSNISPIRLGIEA